MDFVTSTLGITLPVFSARRAAKMEGSTLRRRHLVVSTHGIVSAHRDSFILLKKKFLHLPSMDDDTTVSLSSSSFDDDSSASSSSASVSFADPLVTHVYLRPVTTWAEKDHLFYNEHDFREFRMEYMGYRPARNRLVRFTDTVVSQVWTFPRLEEKANLYYSESELQTFLDEFVMSLQQGYRQE